MNNLQILRRLKNLENFLGVFPIDHLPKPSFFPSCLIVNSQDCILPGEHWITLIFTSARRAYLFCSYGMPPEFYNLDKIYPEKEWFYYPRRVQATWATTCAKHCIYVLKCIFSNKCLQYINNDVYNELLINIYS